MTSPACSCFSAAGLLARHLGDDDALDLVGEAILLAQLVGDLLQGEAELLDRRDDGLVGLGRLLAAALGRRVLLLGLLLLADPELQRHFLAAAPDHESTVVPTRALATKAREAAQVGHVLAGEGDDDVVALETRLGGRAVGHDIGDQHAARAVEAEAVGDVVGHALVADADPAALDLAELAQLVGDLLHEVGRDREGKAGIGAGRRVDRGVDADHLAVGIEQRAARVALVDGGVGLQVVVERILLSERPRAEMMPAVTEWPRPNGLPIAITQSPTRTLSESPNLMAGSGFLFGGSTLSTRHVDAAVGADQLGLELGVVAQDDGDVLGALDHVVVGDDVAFAVDDEARAQRGAAALLLLAAASCRRTP